MLLATLGAGLLRNLLPGTGTIRAGEGTVRAVQPHPLTNFEIQKYYQNEPKFNDVYSRNNLLKIKDGVYVTNLDKFKWMGTHWIAFYVNGNNGRASLDAIYFDSFGAEYTPTEIKKFIGNKNIITNIYRIQTYSSIMCG